MRARLEKEHGDELSLKAGYGGYYDIDFALMYLRLKGGGMFFKVLSALQRIDIIEKMGHLSREDAEFLREAVVFYRSLDHAIRLYFGQAEHELPSSPVALEALTNMMNRWVGSNESPLESQLKEMQNRTRQFFDRLFGV